MLTIAAQQITLVGNGFFADASQLGLFPGEWPNKIVLVNNRSEGMVFLRSLPVIQNHNFQGWNYQSGVIDLTVFEGE